MCGLHFLVRYQYFTLSLVKSPRMNYAVNMTQLTSSNYKTDSTLLTSLYTCRIGPLVQYSEVWGLSVEREIHPDGRTLLHEKKPTVSVRSCSMHDSNCRLYESV